MAFALIVFALGLQMTGEGSHGREVLLDALSEASSHSRTYHARMLFGLCFIDWLEADMHGVRQTAEQVILYGQEHELLESLSFGHYFMGLALYHLDDPARAESHLQLAVQKGQLTNINTYAHSSYLLALTHQVLARSKAAREAAEAVTAYALKHHNTLLVQDAKAFQAELAVRQNRLPTAVHWAKHYDPFPLNPALRYYQPPLTLLKTRIAQNTPESLQQAEGLIERLTKYYSSTHNSRILVELLILQALLCQSLKQRDKALTALQDAINLSRHGGYRRSFIDMGQTLEDLLAEIDRDHPGDFFVNSIRKAIGKSQAEAKAARPAALPVRPSSVHLAEPLSPREVEVLRLLAENLRDKEIAAKLFISPATVKRHCANLYGKLEVKGRREAVERARALGML
jgi:LuxR family maltose regulon positive regulatory protein